MANRQWVLARRPVGTASSADFELREGAMPSADALAPGQILMRNEIFLHAPTMRNWMDEPSNSLYPSVDVGAAMLATSGGTVIASASERFPVGSRVTGISFWEEYSVVDVGVMPVRLVGDNLSLVDAMGAVGVNALTAYMGVTRVGRPVAGETAVVSGAAGSTGSVAGQILRILGCRVIGIAGGAAKCARLVDELGFDAAIDYRSEDVEARLREFAPGGINVFYDNVGGDILQAGVENIAKFGRIVLCGQIAGYNGSVPVQGPRNMMRLVYGSVTMQGFLLGDYEPDIPAARDQLLEWIDAGLLKHREDIRSGFDTLPDTFGDLFTGSNDGTLLVVTDDAARSVPA